MGDTAAPCTLVVGVLTIESSADPDVERPAGTMPDTVQFWLSPSRCWKVRTYAIDRTVQAWDLSTLTGDVERSASFAAEHIAKHYGDVLKGVARIDLPNGTDADRAAEALRATGLGGLLQPLEADDGGQLAMWMPDAVAVDPPEC